MARRSSSPLSEYEQRLKEEEARLIREMAEAEKALRRAPRAAKPSPRPKPEPERPVRLNNVAALDLPRPTDHIFRGGREPGGPRRQHRRRKTDARVAQLKFLLLCLILAAMVLFVWSNFSR